MTGPADNTSQSLVTERADLPLAGVVALVTGGGRGIGAGICEELVRQGASLMVNDLHDNEATQATLTALREVDGDVAFHPGDVSIVDEVQAMVRDTVGTFGRIDLLVNNAGDGRYDRPEDITEEKWDRAIGIHLKGPFFAAQAAAAHMLEQGGGKIVNIASEQAFIGYAVLPHYTAAKAGLLTLTRSLALAWAPTILVNAVCPGPTDTPKLRLGHEFNDEVRNEIPLKRFGLPRDVALSVAFLAGEGGDFFTGQHLDPNGGTVMP
jgi:NAD(P)-dependent dehydrogenase (short-subunit alcohol dehydrogenase family)